MLESAALVAAIDRSADAATARTVVARVIEARPTVAEELTSNELLRDGLIALACASRSLSSAVIADATLLDPLRDPEGFAREYAVDDYRVAWQRGRARRRTGHSVGGSGESSSASPPATCSVPPTSRPSVVSSLRSRRCAWRPRSPSQGAEDPFAVIGMGKLGGRELNYASDVDVLFVHDGDGERAERVARSLLNIMTTPTEDGIVFRTDADLRPEGRSGPLTRTIDSYASYYEGWAQTWEFQALLKARPVAGDASLGERFMALTRPFVWPGVLRPDALREIRAMKERSEDVTERKGLADRELKRGRGGIRDIEFAVQLLQLVHGRHDESVRSPNTLDALHALSSAEYVEAADAARLDDAYRFLRTVEHRLQLYDEQQTHTIPADERARTRLARRSRLPRRRRAGARSRRSKPTIAPTRPRCGRSTSGCSSLPCSTRSRVPARCHPRLHKSGWPPSASPTSSGRAPRSASSRSG